MAIRTTGPYDVSAHRQVSALKQFDTGQRLLPLSVV